MKYSDSKWKKHLGSLPGGVNDAGIFEYRGNKVYAAVLINDSPDNHSGQELIAEIGGYVYDRLSVAEVQ